MWYFALYAPSAPSPWYVNVAGQEQHNWTDCYNDACLKIVSGSVERSESSEVSFRSNLTSIGIPFILSSCNILFPLLLKDMLFLISSLARLIPEQPVRLHSKSVCLSSNYSCGIIKNIIVRSFTRIKKASKSNLNVKKKVFLRVGGKTDVWNIRPAVDKFKSDMESVRSQRSVRVNNTKHMVLWLYWHSLKVRRRRFIHTPPITLVLRRCERVKDGVKDPGCYENKQVQFLLSRRFTSAARAASSCEDFATCLQSRTRTCSTTHFNQTSLFNHC